MHVVMVYTQNRHGVTTLVASITAIKIIRLISVILIVISSLVLGHFDILC